MMLPISEFQNPDWIIKNVRKENAAVFVAEDDGKIVGYSLGWIGQPWGYKGKRGYFCDCFVEEPYRRQGVGLALSKALIEWFKEKNVECIEADVYSGNEESLKMFKKLGFKEVSKRLRIILKK